MDEIKSLRTKKQDMKALKEQKDQPEKDQTEKAAMEKTELTVRNMTKKMLCSYFKWHLIIICVFC